MQVDHELIMNNPFIAEVISAKSDAESERLTSIEQAKLTQTRADNLNAEIEKIVSKRRYQGDRVVFRNSEEFMKAGMKILEKYNATENEKTWFLGLV
tara:strand:- start:617 stop:907 length:291 start_codon:yes stop_codon:yes gene_type:complete